MVTFQLGAAINLDVLQSINALWGNAVEVYNFFSKASLQPASIVYAANASVIGGESAGWNLTLRSLAARSQNGFNYGDLRIGYPGHHIMPRILDTEYGSRWLGILAAFSLTPEEYSGAKAIYLLLKSIASKGTAQYILDLEQCEKMWTLSKELFLDSPVQHEFLTIVSKCAVHCEADFVEYTFIVEDGDQLDATPISTVMMAAFRIWEMAQTGDRTGCRLWAEGASGIGHLILYLTVVCGFHVTVRLDHGEAQFGQLQNATQVVIQLNRTLEENWKTGYLIEQLSVEESVQHWLGTAQEMTPWKPGAGAFAPSTLSTYAVYEQPGCPTPIKITKLSVWWPLKIAVAELTCEEKTRLSLSLASYINYIISSVPLVSSNTVPSSCAINYVRAQALSERLEAAIMLFDHQFLEQSHVADLIWRIREERNPAPAKYGKAFLPDRCIRRYGEISYGPADTPDLDDLRQSMQSKLADYAWELWLYAQIEVHAQRILYMTRYWIPHNSPLEDSKEWDVDKRIDTNMVLTCIADRLACRQLPRFRESLLGCAVAGAVIGLRANETFPALEDPGHCIYITPGKIETPERRLQRVFEEPMPPYLRSGPSQATSVTLDQVQEPQTGFSDTQLMHIVRTQGDTAYIATRVKLGNVVEGFFMLSAIDKSLWVPAVHGCFKKCAKGRLAQTEVERVRIVDEHNWVHPWSPSMAQEKQELLLVLAYDNTIVQRAAMASTPPNQCIIMQGRCVHCAVRAALERKMHTLIV